MEDDQAKSGHFADMLKPMQYQTGLIDSCATLSSQVHVGAEETIAGRARYMADGIMT